MDTARTRAQGRGEPEAAEKTEAAAGGTRGQRCHARGVGRKCMEGDRQDREKHETQ